MTKVYADQIVPTKGKEVSFKNVNITGKLTASQLSAPVAVAFNDLSRFVISNGTDTAHDIDISSGKCRDTTDTYNLEVTSSGLTIALDSTGVNGLDTGSVAADTWYYIWLIRKDSDGSIDALFSLSATSPTMPSGYTYKRRIRGAVLTDVSANIIGFTQYGDNFIFNERITDLSDTTPVTSKTDINVSTPDSLTVIGLFNIVMRDSSESYINLYGLNQTDRAASTDNGDFSIDPSGQAAVDCQRIAENGVVSYKSSNGNMDAFKILTRGFIDNAEL